MPWHRLGNCPSTCRGSVFCRQHIPRSLPPFTHPSHSGSAIFHVYQAQCVCDCQSCHRAVAEVQSDTRLDPPPSLKTNQKHEMEIPSALPTSRSDTAVSVQRGHAF